jgi:hypothetical protein
MVSMNDTALAGESGEDGIDAVHAGPGHETDVEGRVRQRMGLMACRMEGDLQYRTIGGQHAVTSGQAL